MDIRRVILYAALGLVSYNILINWQHDYPVLQQPTKPASVVTKSNHDPLLPQVLTNELPEKTTQAAKPLEAARTSEWIHVTTDVLDISID